jgi:hypothetical protein
LIRTLVNIGLLFAWHPRAPQGCKRIQADEQVSSHGDGGFDYIFFDGSAKFKSKKKRGA